MFKMKPEHRRGLSVAKQRSFREMKDARLHSRLLDDNTALSCHFPMALSDIKTTESGKHDWLSLYFLILLIISNTQTHNDHQHKIQKLRSGNQISLPKGQTVCLIQFNLVKGQSSEDSHCLVLSELLRIADLYYSTWTIMCRREEVKSEFQPWIHLC